jgi:isopenicillin N synthase-like dioxygenase
VAVLVSILLEVAIMTNLGNENIPVIDFSDYRGDTDIPQNLLDSVRHACENIGFFYIINHGVDISKLKSVNRVSGDFFEKDQVSKLPFASPDLSRHGWVALNREVLDHNTPKSDYKEMFDVRPGVPPTTFPSDDFESDSLSLFKDCKLFALKLLRVLAGILPDELKDIESWHKSMGCDGNVTALRLLYYPSNEGQASRCGEHTDYGTFTLLFQDMIGGLEVRSPKDDDSFIKVIPLEGAMLVNVADLLSLWTKGRFVSSRHRVVGNISGSIRRSIAFFVHPDPGTKITKSTSQSELVTDLSHFNKRITQSEITQIPNGASTRTE